MIASGPGARRPRRRPDPMTIAFVIAVLVIVGVGIYFAATNPQCLIYHCVVIKK